MRPQLESLPGASDSLTVAQLAEYVQRQLQNIANSVAGLYEGEGEVYTSAPPKPRESMFKYADGTAWNPASVGKGLVVFDGTNWLPLYSTPTMLLNAIKTVDGASSGLDADLLDGNDSSFFLAASSYTAADVLTKIKTVDGAGSGLDADTLDALDSSYFLNAGNLSAGTLLAARMPAHTGDVTSTAGSVALAIGANKVTLGMLAQLATGNLLGRITAATGNVEAVPFSQGLTASTIAQRDVLGDLWATHSVVGDGSTSQPGFCFVNDNNTGIRRVGTDSMALVSAGADRMTVIATGEWGVGITPSARNNCNFQLGNSLGFPATQVASTDANALDDYEEGTWTPTITAGSGTFTTVSGNGTYTKIGREVHVKVQIVITTNGTAAAYVVATLPFTSSATNYAQGCGRETAITGTMLQSITYASDGNITILTYNNAYPGASGYTLMVTQTYMV